MKVRPFRRSTTILGLRLPNKRPGPLGNPVMLASAGYGANGGLHERHPGSVCKPHSDAARHGLAIGVWAIAPAPMP